MVVKIDNASKYLKTKGDMNWYKWKIFLKGSDDELDGIEHVTYILHPTFPNPIRKITDRASGFELSASGWGEFEIKAKIKYKTGKINAITYWLDLSKKGAGDTRPEATP